MYNMHMTQVGQSISFSEELITAIRVLASSKKQPLSQFLEFQLREVSIIKETIRKLEKIPDLPPMVKGSIPYSTVEEI